MQAPPAKAVRVVEPQKEKRLPAAKRRQIEARQDADDFAAEYRMLKKVKRGKMSEVRTSAQLFACMRQDAQVWSGLPKCVIVQSMPAKEGQDTDGVYMYVYIEVQQKAVCEEEILLTKLSSRLLSH